MKTLPTFRQFVSKTKEPQYTNVGDEDIDTPEANVSSITEPQQNPNVAIKQQVAQKIDEPTDDTSTPVSTTAQSTNVDTNIPILQPQDVEALANDKQPEQVHHLAAAGEVSPEDAKKILDTQIKRASDAKNQL